MNLPLSKIFIAVSLVLLLIGPRANAAIIFEDNFDSPTYTGWTSASDNVGHTSTAEVSTMLGGYCNYLTDLPCWHSWDQGAGSNGIRPPNLYSIDTAEKKSGTQSFQCDYETSQYINGGSFNALFTKDRTTGYDDIWYQFWLYIPNNWSGINANPWKVLHSNTGVNVATESINNTFDEFGKKRGMAQYFEIVLDGNGTYRLLLQWLGPPNQAGTGYAWDRFVYSPSATNYSKLVGKWSFVQVHIKMNTFTGATPNADAVFDAWVIPSDEIGTYNPGTPTISAFGQTPGHLIEDPARKTNAAILFGNMNPPDAALGSTTTHYQMRMDDFVVSTTQLSPNYVVTRSPGSDVGAPPPDTTPPTCSAFAFSATSTSLTVPITTPISCTDAVGVTGYVLSEVSNPPASGTVGSPTVPTSLTFGGVGIRTGYLYARDAAGNWSNVRSSSTTISEAQIPSGAGGAVMGIRGRSAVSPTGRGWMSFVP